MTKRINTEKAPAAIGPYSQGVAAGNFLFVSGQLPIDPKTGSIDADNVADQARQSLTNLSQIYAQFFQGEVLPARSAVEVAKLPKGALVEIEAVAAL